MAFSPDEANSPLIVDADRMLSSASAAQGFEPVSRRDKEIVEPLCVVKQTQLS
jgi:hypothetical protein